MSAIPAGSADPSPDAPPEPSPGQRLATRIVVLSAVALALVLSMIGGTLWLSWQLEGAGAAINDAGSLRMRANAIAISLFETRAGHASSLRAQMGQLDGTLARLREGDPARPLFLPDDPQIRRQFRIVETTWQNQLKPAVQQDLQAASTTPSVYLGQLTQFVTAADALVSLIEQENARKTAWLRLSQLAVAALSCIGTVAIVYMLYLWFVVPVQRLQEGLWRIEARQFDARLPVDTRDEFGHLAAGFNRMAAELQALYRELAQRVDAKTAELAAQNRELGMLYEMAAFLNRPDEVDALCRGFLTRLIYQFEADGGTVRLTAPDDRNLHLVVSEGLPANLVRDERCMPAEHCICGEAASRGVSIVRNMTDRSAAFDAVQGHCVRAGFVEVAAFGITSQGEVLGSFSLHFRRDRPTPPSEVKLLETLGKHLGTALNNRRLAALARQLAVSEERNLVAQGLHDSIAQTLNFLKMQVHLLKLAASEGNLAEIDEIVPLLEGGVGESYDDVRELLSNFRTRLGEGELRRAVDDTVARFRTQAGIPVTLDYREDGGAPLAPDQQLQVLFILQEALSNIRKHAQAQHVRVLIVNARAFRLLVEDDGEGYVLDDIDADGESHVGFHIMRERAARIDATLRLDGSRGHGARVELLVPEKARQTA
ncbi:HAMP domain-containing protein [Paraburkholderia sp. Tr-20389]|uniref:type IV pili methyl-accepting chemotaxis transducer N-terminal domain-containing protein n=1 Tax=Paraburkholderia sp. Tr-20389 TaxID=2703903 RepID=UPI00197E3C8D|nr:type IV pili methyl-accepting chemotaxis transducer N-terminal domain-containing protein [Paraburkholderia sp. Tr-20389]MBN3757719.1 HAMP domain-containing protein [Paraburkholderia sp. Tr-20389]